MTLHVGNTLHYSDDVILIICNLHEFVHGQLSLIDGHTFWINVENLNRINILHILLTHSLIIQHNKLINWINCENGVDWENVSFHANCGFDHHRNCKRTFSLEELETKDVNVLFLLILYFLWHETIEDDTHETTCGHDAFENILCGDDSFSVWIIKMNRSVVLCACFTFFDVVTFLNKCDNSVNISCCVVRHCLSVLHDVIVVLCSGCVCS